MSASIDLIVNAADSVARRRAVMLRRQCDALRKLVRHAWEKSRFYRELYSAAGIKERDLTAIEADDLPLIGKRVLMDNFDLAVTDPRLKKTDLERWVTEVGGPSRNYLEEFVGSDSTQLTRHR